MSTNSSGFHTETKRVNGLGTAHHGTGHFWFQRTTALVMIPLTVWFLVELLSTLLKADRAAVLTWFHNPIHAVLMAFLTTAMFWHAKLGIQVILEDYVHCHCGKIASLLLNSGLKITLGVLCLVAIARLHFGM